MRTTADEVMEQSVGQGEASVLKQVHLREPVFAMVAVYEYQAVVEVELRSLLHDRLAADIRLQAHDVMYMGRKYRALRLSWMGGNFNADAQGLAKDMAPLEKMYRIKWSATLGQPVRVAVVVSDALHCVEDLLNKADQGAIYCDIKTVLSNSDEASFLARSYGIQYATSREVSSLRDTLHTMQKSLLDANRIELVVFARYRQTVTPELCRELDGNAISVAPGLSLPVVGNTYDRAHADGHKLIGVSTHFVVMDLQRGPIIAQSIDRIEQGDSLADVRARGAALEARVLTESVRLFCQRRLAVVGNQTVEFHA